MNEKLMDEVVKEGVSEMDAVKVIESKSNLLPGLAIGVGVIVVSGIVYKKMLRPVGKKILKKVRKIESEETSTNDDVDYEDEKETE